MLNARYYPAWLLPDGETEKFADNQQTVCPDCKLGRLASEVS